MPMIDIYAKVVLSPDTKKTSNCARSHSQGRLKEYRYSDVP